jgi:hypothetical protein
MQGLCEHNKPSGVSNAAGTRFLELCLALVPLLVEVSNNELRRAADRTLECPSFTMRRHRCDLPEPHRAAAACANWSINVVVGIDEDMCWGHTQALRSSGPVVHDQMMQRSKN